MFATSITTSVSTLRTRLWFLFTNEPGRAEKMIASVSGRLIAADVSFDFFSEVRYFDGVSCSYWAFLGDGQD